MVSIVSNFRAALINESAPPQHRLSRRAARRTRDANIRSFALFVVMQSVLIRNDAPELSRPSNLKVDHEKDLLSFDCLVLVIFKIENHVAENNGLALVRAG
jgi:hypothetical protein